MLEGTAQKLLAYSEEGAEEKEKGSILQDAKDYILKILADGELTPTELYGGASISKHTITRAKKRTKY